jgi:SAM-dependent methyltransferase
MADPGVTMLGFDSALYWEVRYLRGETSGRGSTGDLARFKAEFLSEFVRAHGIRSILELGCGNGDQLSVYDFGPVPYLGLDVSRTAVERCRVRFAGDAMKRFALLDEAPHAKAELALSIDVIYHLVEDDVYRAHMARLFDAADRYVVVYSSDAEERPEGCGEHCRLRKFTDWVERERPEWRLVERVPNRHPWSEATPGGSRSEFFVFAPRW